MENNYYHFTKNNIEKSLVPKSMFDYPQLEKIIIKEKGKKDIIYDCVGFETSIYTGYNSWWKTNDIKIDIHKLIDTLFEINIKSIIEVTRQKQIANTLILWKELIIRT